MSTETPVVSDRYAVQRLLRRGLLTDDHLGHDLLLDRPVVFKVLTEELLTDRAFVDRFRLQAQTAANLTHPAITAVYDWGRDRASLPSRGVPTYYLVTEYFNGRTVADFVHTKGAPPTARALHIAIGVTTAISYAHRAGVVHGALSPDVVMVGPSGQVKVSEIGMRAALDPTRPIPDDHVAEAYFLAPEQFRGESATPATDVYQIGLLLYFLATGEVPFPGSTVATVAERHRTAFPAAPSKTNPDVPRGVEMIIGRALAKNPAERYASVNDLRAALVREKERLADTDTDTDTDSDSESDTGPASYSDDDVTAAATLVTAPVVGESVVSAKPEVRTVTASSIAKPAADGAVVSGAANTADDPTMLSTTQVMRSPRDERVPLAVAEQRNNRRPRTWPYVLTFIILLGVLGGLLFALARQLGVGGTTGRTIAMPDVVAKPVAEAQSELSKLGLDVKTSEEANEQYDAGIVFAQDIAPNTKVAENSSVNILVSAGKKLPVVPDVEKKTLDEARSALAAAGFNFEVKEREAENSEPGTVLSQDPAGSTKIAVGEALPVVKLVVASGQGKVVVPDVTGKSIDDARVAMNQAGFRFVVQSEASATVVANSVVRTNPPAGTKVPKGDTVEVYVSAGSSVKVPSVIGQTDANAAKNLTDAGFVPDPRPRAVTDPGQVQTVVAQTPNAGQGVAPGATITIYVGVLDQRPTTTKAPKGSTTTTVLPSDNGEQPAATTVAPEPPVTVATTPAPEPTAAPPEPATTVAPAPAPAPAPPPPAPTAVPAGGAPVSSVG